MKNESFYTILAEQIALLILNIFGAVKFTEYMTVMVLIKMILTINFGLLLSRITFLVLKKYEDKHSIVMVHIARFFIVSFIVCAAIYSFSYIANETVGIKTFIVLVICFICYIYLTSIMGIVDRKNYE